jgi:hypothetical protein
MDSAILIAALILNPRARKRREGEAAAGTAVVIGATNALGSTSSIEFLVTPSVFASPTDTLDVENQGGLAGVGQVIEEKKTL